jgi:hypothetical protein
MKKVAVIGVMMVMLLATNWVRADVCQIVNGSFENDGPISDITKKAPTGWQVNVPASKFGGYIRSEWITDGRFNATLYSQDYVNFNEGDAATVSQQMYLADVNQIVFDVKLETFYGTKWDPNLCAAVLLIDDDVVWESNSVGSDVRGEYRDQVYTVGDKYRDDNLHSFSLGIRVKVTEKLKDFYKTQWDLVECTYYCGGGGLLPGDFNRDCYVDISDLKLVADAWLDEVDPHYGCNLYRDDDLAGYGTISFGDFALYAVHWDGNMASLGEFAGKWLNEVDLGDPYNLFGGDDVEGSGIINFLDFTIFTDNWRGSSLVQEIVGD